MNDDYYCQCIKIRDEFNNNYIDLDGNDDRYNNLSLNGCLEKNYQKIRVQRKVLIA